MSTQTPAGAKWNPIANGYIQNGKVVSTTPQYDSNGKFLEVVNGTATTQPTYVSKQPNGQATWNPYASGYVENNGKLFSTTPQYDTSGKFLDSISTQGNTQGSNQDKNSVATNAGAMASLNNNLENAQISPQETTVTQAVTPDETSEWMNQYNDHIAQDNLSGQVDDMTQLNNATLPQQAQEMTPQANNTVMQPNYTAGEQAAQQAVDNIDNRIAANYEKRINDAKLEGNYPLAEQLQSDLDNFYAMRSVSPVTGEQMVSTLPQTPEEAYETELARLDEKYDNAYKELETNYQMMYGATLNDITNGIVAQLGNLMNFQYDPTKDRALHIAQGYAQAKVKETMNATGMYYSTMTQSAITKAVAELVPVYEKMAKEEIQTNLQMLFNVGNYLMNLENQQFNMWKTQVEFKIEAIEQKRKDVSQALQRAEFMGYVDNQASAILGIPAGTLTYKARKDAQDRQDAIDKELRGYTQQKVMAVLNSDLQMERDAEQAKLEIEKLREQYNLMDRNNARSAARDYEYKSRLQKEATQQAQDLASGVPYYEDGTLDASKMEDLYYNLIENKGYTNDEAIKAALNEAKGKSERALFLSSIGEDPKKWLEAPTTEEPAIDIKERKEEYPDVNENTRNVVESEDALAKLQKYYADGGDAKALENLIKGMQAESDEASQIYDVLNDVLITNPQQGFRKALEELTNGFSKDNGKSKKAFEGSINLINSYSDALDNLGIDDSIKAEYEKAMYKTFIDEIADAKDIDMTWTNFNDNTKDSKWRAGQQIAKIIADPKNEYLNETKTDILSYVAQKLAQPTTLERNITNVKIDGLNNTMEVTDKNKNKKTVPIFAG